MTQLGPDVLRTITAEHVDALAAGATLLGSGGGGDVALGRLLLRNVLGDRPVTMVSAGELTSDALVVHVGVVGAPDVLAERLLAPRDLALAAEAVVDQIRGDLAAVGVIEIGGLNALIAVLAAAQLNVPVVDGDLMGRAFPSISKTTIAAAGHQPAPLAVVGPAGDTVVVPSSSPRMAESLVAACVSAMGGAAALALYPTTAKVLEAVGVKGSLSSCLTLGSTYLSQDTTGIAALADRLGGRLLFEGRVDEIRPRLDNAPGCITLTDQGHASTVRVDHLEEFLAVTHDGTTVARTPDVIVALDSSNVPLRTDQIRLGQTLAMLNLPAMHNWPAEAAIRVGPAAFGLELEELSG